MDALVSCGFKWLCGPYGTGFCYNTEADLDRALEVLDGHTAPVGSG